MAKRFSDVLVVALVLAVGAAVLATDQALAKDDFSKSLKEAREKHDEYRAKVTDETVVQETRKPTNAGDMITESTIYSKGDRFRIDAKITMSKGGEEEEASAKPQLTTTVIHDGESTWMLDPFMGKRQLNRREAQKYRNDDYWWSLIPEKAQVVGSENLGERECYVVVVSGVGEERGIKMWLDKKTSAIVISETEIGEGQKSRMVNSDFRKVEAGWEMPFKTEIMIGESLVSTLIVKSREVNKGLSDDLFNPDKVSAEAPGMEGMKKLIETRGGEGD